MNNALIHALDEANTLVEIIQTAPDLAEYWLKQFTQRLIALPSTAEREGLYARCRPLLLSRDIGVKLASVILNQIVLFDSKNAILIDVIKTFDNGRNVIAFQPEMDIIFDLCFDQYQPWLTQTDQGTVPDLIMISAQFILRFLDQIECESERNERIVRVLPRRFIAPVLIELFALSHTKKGLEI